VLELAGKAFVEVAVVAETRQRIGERESDGPQRPQQRTLVELDREQRTHEGQGQQGRSLQSTTSVRTAEPISVNGRIVFRTLEAIRPPQERRVPRATTAVIRRTLTR